MAETPPTLFPVPDQPTTQGSRSDTDAPGDRTGGHTPSDVLPGVSGADSPPTSPASDEHQPLLVGAAAATTGGTVVALNEAAEVFDALALGIRGSAVGWPPAAVEELEVALQRRYGPMIGGDGAVARLVALARGPAAA